ncbi:hypothetical protein SAMN05192579_102194 [Rhodanobacter glycinis]|uniref:Uncharacterized protein n=1 Tax=Rhodanobacter glycinis TaxID=582702 RepID=A0A1I3Z4D7_9GAMM|nr:hypothetical protein SAMN05192579_102194 [Rhodanobacter glycinis]
MMVFSMTSSPHAWGCFHCPLRLGKG